MSDSYLVPHLTFSFLMPLGVYNYLFNILYMCFFSYPTLFIGPFVRWWALKIFHKKLSYTCMLTSMACQKLLYSICFYVYCTMLLQLKIFFNKKKIKKNSYLILSYGFHLQYKLNRFTKQMVHWVLYTCICNKNKSYTIRTTKYAFQMIDCLITYQF